MSETDVNRRGSKRRPRTVATLTEHEIQHKRDLDRRAQRAYRQRTKTRIEDLENDLSRTQASRSDRENKLLQELQYLREQNRHLKSCLQSIGQFALDSVANDGSLTSEDAAPKAQQPTQLDASTSSDGDDCVYDIDGFRTQTPQISYTDLSRQHTMSAGNDKTPISNLREEQPRLATQSPIDNANIPFDPVKPRMPLDLHAGSRTIDSALVRLERNEDQITATGHHDSLLTPNSGPVMTRMSPSTIESRVALMLPSHNIATCPLDQILLDFLSSRRSLLARGTPVESLLGPEKPAVKAILYPDLVDSVHTISRVISDIMLTFSTVKLPEKLGFVYKMYHTLRWQICPNPDTYAKMPNWLRPTLAQIAVPHAAWIDNIPWPQVRNMLIEHPEKYPFSVFSELYSRHVSVNWPFDSMDTIIRTDDQDVILNPIFEKHIQRLSNWTVTPEFEEYFPEMKPALNFLD